LSEVKVSSLKLCSIKLGSSTSNKLHVWKVGELVLPRTSCLIITRVSENNISYLLIPKLLTMQRCKFRYFCNPSQEAPRTGRLDVVAQPTVMLVQAVIVPGSHRLATLRHDAVGVRDSGS
jgi:hypothetical protein